MVFLIIFIYATIGLLLGIVFEKKIKEGIKAHEYLLTQNESVESAVNDIKIMYIFIWIPLFFIDYFIYYRKK